MRGSATVRVVPAILTATAWIPVHGILRSQLILIEQWTGHHTVMGLSFPGEPINGALWALCIASMLFVLSRSFYQIETTALAGPRASR